MKVLGDAGQPCRPIAQPVAKRWRRDAAMKLYYPPRTCSMAPRVAPCEAGLRYNLEKVDLAATTTEDGAGYTRRGAAECVMGKA
jgi:hypothetical protein